MSSRTDQNVWSRTAYRVESPPYAAQCGRISWFGRDRPLWRLSSATLFEIIIEFIMVVLIGFGGVWCGFCHLTPLLSATVVVWEKILNVIHLLKILLAERRRVNTGGSPAALDSLFERLFLLEYLLFLLDLWASATAYSRLIRIGSHEPATNRSSFNIIPFNKFGLRHTFYTQLQLLCRLLSLNIVKCILQLFDGEHVEIEILKPSSIY